MNKYILSECIEREISTPEIYPSLLSAQMAMAEKLGQALDIPAEICLNAIRKDGVHKPGDGLDDEDEMGVTALSAYCHVQYQDMDWKIHEITEPDPAEYLYVVSSRRDYPDSDESYYGADGIYTSQEEAEQAVYDDMDDTLVFDLADEPGPCTDDRENLYIQAGNKYFGWRIDPLLSPYAKPKDKSVLYEDEVVKVETTGRDYDFIATIENKTERTIYLTFASGLEYGEACLEIEGHDWAGLLADDTGYLHLADIKAEGFEYTFNRPDND